MLNEFWAKWDVAAKKGIKILSADVAVTEHIYYITVQARDYQTLLAFLEPLAPTQTGKCGGTPCDLVRAQQAGGRTRGSL